MAEEKRFENKIKRYLNEQGCWNVKFFANAYTKKGVPDILACINGFFVGIEVKAKNGIVSELQKWNISEIRKSGGIAIVLYPQDFEKFKKLVELLKTGNNFSENNSMF